MTAPVMLFTYSRPEHTEKVLEALAANTLASETDVYAYTCKPGKPTHEESVNATKAVLNGFDGSVFRSYTVVDKEEFKPLGPAMVEAVSETIAKHGRVIVVEDDIVTSPHYLEFMNRCLDFYEDDPRVFSISGYSPALGRIQAMEGDVYLVRRACPWGWATWADRWESYDYEVSWYKERMRDRGTRRRLMDWSPDLPMTLDALFYEKGCMDKNWEQQFCLCQFIGERGTICPTKSLVENIGFDGSGTHEVPTGLGNSYDPESSEWELKSLEFDSALQKEYGGLFVFRKKTRIMIAGSNVVHMVSPSLYYKILRKYYE